MSERLTTAQKAGVQIPERHESLKAVPQWRRRHMLYQEIDDRVVSELTEYGIPVDVAEQVACAIVQMLVEEWAGQQILFPADYHYRLSARDLELYKEHAAGVSITALAQRYSVGERAVRKIIKRVRERHARPQTDLFGAGA
jgi:Mor family transcriptional regulator